VVRGYCRDDRHCTLGGSFLLSDPISHRDSESDADGKIVVGRAGVSLYDLRQRAANATGSAAVSTIRPRFARAAALSGPDSCYRDSRERWDRTRLFSKKHGSRVVLGESSEFRHLRHAVEKVTRDRERAIKNVYRLYRAKALNTLPPGIRATALALQNLHV
jgi:hypothetical protein